MPESFDAAVELSKSPIGGRLASWFKKLGPGLITGAADDDPSGIATYSIAGATTGYTMLWAALFTTPMMAALEGVCARVGVVTGTGLMAALARSMPRPLAIMLGFTVVLANMFNLGADIAAMGATAHLLIALPVGAWIVLFAAVIVVVEVYFSYRRFANILKWLCASLLAYVITAFIVHPPWPLIIWSAIIPHVAFNGAWFTTLMATLGTTITPYLFFWQSSMSLEEKAERHSGAVHAKVTARQIRAIHVDVNSGAIYSNLIMFFIIVTCAATLGSHGPKGIATAADAALALRPLAGNFAFALFALGIIGTGLLAVPVLAGSSAYIVTELYGLREGLNKKPLQAKGYYTVIIAGVAAGTLLALLHVDPIKALYWSAVCNGLAAVPLIYAIIRIASDPRVVGEWPASRSVLAWLWTSFIVMFAGAVSMIVTRFIPS